MGKRTKHAKPPPEAISVDWRSYQPREPRYWMFGGPYIQPEDIPAQRRPGSDIGFHMKPGARRKWALKCKEDAERSLKEATARYVGVKTHGSKGISPSIWEHWCDRRHGCSVVEGRDPNPVHEALAFAFRDIGWQKGTIQACDAAIDEIDRRNEPLLGGLD